MFNNMNVGSVIKITANVLCILEILGCIIFFFAYSELDFSYGPDNAVSFGVGIGGSITAFVSNLALYGFGIIVEKYEDNDKNR